MTFPVLNRFIRPICVVKSLISKRRFRNRKLKYAIQNSPCSGSGGDFSFRFPARHRFGGMVQKSISEKSISFSISSSVGNGIMPRSSYIKGKVLGEGTWGIVYEATRKTDNLAVAIKRIKSRPGDRSGVNFSGLREIKYLKELRHKNIIQVSHLPLS